MPDLPSGTVTFLFTDIESSTALWEQDRAAMQAAVERHLTLLREAVAAHGGVLFKVIGDAVQAAFPTAPDAVAAAHAAQWALRAEAWPTSVGSLPVRMALHTAAATPRESDYLASGLNRLARMLAAGHGGQVLVSRATQELARDALPPGSDLRDLGEHRLRDLFRPEHIFQLHAPELPSQFPPLLTLEQHPNNLPLQPTLFLGREREVAQIVDLLTRAEARLLTLTGPGGVGKTRLALQVAADVLDHFPDGVFVVELAQLADPALVTATMGQVLGVRAEGNRPLIDVLGSFLRPKTLLLLLDNFEHLLEAAPVAGSLLRDAAGLKILATSRSPLRLRGEREVPIAPLAVPDPRRHESLERLSQYEAVRLFIARAQDARPDFAVTNETAPGVAEICARLDGLPLAIELAAARVKLLPPPALLARLERRLPLLTGGARDAPARQQALRNTIDWSYDLLGQEQQALFRTLSVFAGGWTLDAAEAIANPDHASDVFEALIGLIDASLVQHVDQSRGEPRFSMLETIREFGQEQLTAHGEDAEMRNRHAAFFQELATRAVPDLELGRFSGGWFARLDHERDNIRAALTWCLAQREPERALLTAGAMVEYWGFRGDFREGLAWCEQALALAQANTTPLARSGALYGVATLGSFQGNHTRALAAAQQMLEVAECGEQPIERVRALFALAFAGRRQGNFDQAAEHARTALALARQVGALGWVGWALIQIGENPANADADAMVEEALVLFRELASEWGQVNALAILADRAAARHEVQRAAHYYQESLVLRQAIEDRWGTVDILVGTAGLAARRDHLEEATQLVAAALRWAKDLGYSMDYSVTADPHDLASLLQRRLPAASYEGAWSRGAGLTPGAAIALAEAMLSSLAPE